MQAIVRDGYGGPEKVRLVEVDTPVAGDGQVLVRVAAASVNAADLDVLRGRPAFARVMTGLRGPRERLLGSDLAGRVEAIGPGVTRFSVGDEVFGDLTRHGLGAFAEYACAPEAAFAARPSNLSAEEAAGLPWSGITALQSLSGARPVGPGQSVLVNGASGNVGPFAIQIAKAFGAEVTGVCSTAKMDFVRSLGADHVVDYTRDDVTRLGRRFDRILDVASRQSIIDYRRILRPGGVYVWIGGTLRGFFGAVVLGPVISLAGSRRMGLMWWWRPFRQEDVAALTDLVEAGHVRPVINRSYPLAQVADALAYVEGGAARGKVAITV